MSLKDNPNSSIMKRISIVIAWLLSMNLALAQKTRNFELASPDNKVRILVNIDENTSWSVKHDGQTILAPSFLSIRLNTGEVLGKKLQIVSSKTETINESFNA